MPQEGEELLVPVPALAQPGDLTGGDLEGGEQCCGAVPDVVVGALLGLPTLRTPWGLFRHYWVVIALVLTTLSLAVMLLHMPSVSRLAGLARSADDAAASRLGGDVLHPALGLLVLIVITVLNVHKPRGLTPYGQHKQAKEPKGSTRNRAVVPR
jgi:hypothetical protein